LLGRAYQPDLRQLKKDPDALVAKALAALEREFIEPEQE
jgi:hypothetical protein